MGGEGLTVTEERLIKASTLLKAIDPDKVTWRFGVPNTLDTMIDFLRLIINEQPAVDAVEVVRCKDCRHCKYQDENDERGDCDIHETWTTRTPESFCCYGERRQNDH